MKTIGGKVTLLLLLMLSIGMINILVVFTYYRHQENDIHQVNIAGRQRMLSQRMTKYVLLIERGYDRHDKLLQAERNYDDSLRKLQFGGVVSGLSLPRAPASMAPLFAKNNDLWKAFREAVLVIEKHKSESKASREAKEYVYRHNEDLLKISQEITTAFDQIFDQKVNLMKLTLILLVGFDFIVFIIGMRLAYLEITFPIKQLTKATSEIVGRGDTREIPIPRTHDELEAMAIAFNDLIRQVSRLSFGIVSAGEAMIMTDEATNIEYVNPAFSALTGYSAEEVIGKKTDLMKSGRHSSSFYEGMWSDLRAGRIWSGEVQNQRKDGTFYIAKLTISPILRPDRTIDGYISVHSDVTKLKEMTSRVEQSLREKEILLQEVHHRVKNNMQIISSLLNLQIRSIQDPALKAVIRDSQNRIKSMAIIHEKLYRSDDLESIDFKDYVHNLTHDLIRSYGNSHVRVQIDITDIRLDVETAIPCGLIINEIFSNSLKYAFPSGQDGEVFIRMTRLPEGKYELSIRDNGIGFPVDMDIRKTQSLGFSLITSLSENQLGGHLEYSSGVDGVAFTIVF